MKIKYLYIVIAIISLLSCENDQLQKSYSDISLFQGNWTRCDSTDVNNPFVENLVINNSAMQYCLYNKKTDFVCDKQNGMVLLGDNSKMEWNTVSDLNNFQTYTYWTVKEVNNDKLWLYSDSLGNRIFQKQSSATSPVDTMACISQLMSYKDLLPVNLEDIKKQVYAIQVQNGIKILLNNPCCANITFQQDDDSDSIRSYSFDTKDLGTSYNSLILKMSFVHEHDGISDYCDASSLAKSSYVLSVETAKNNAILSTIKGYNYWVNVTNYLNQSIDYVKQQLSDLAYEYKSTGYNGTLPTYQFKCNGAKGYKYLTFATDSEGKVFDIVAEFPKNYIDVESCLFMLNKKYQYDRTENGIYIYKEFRNPSLEVAYNPTTRIMHYYLID